MEQPAILTKQEFVNKLGKMQPIYGLTSGVTNNQISKAIALALKETELPKDYLPKSIRDQYDLMEFKKAIKLIHTPKNMDEMLQARKRVVFDEFFEFSLAIQYMKSNRVIMKNENVMEPSAICDDLLS